jgi:Tol biopolymer transport system component
VSSRQSKSSDDLDIWYVERKADGAWGPAQRLPEPVNSPASELLPRVDAQGRLYFGSSREGGFGQSDIYVATRTKDDKWQVSNMGAPISTKANEYEAEVSQDGNALVVVADRGDRSHLYLYRKREGNWIEQRRIPAFDNVFQVGPLLSPKGDRLLFAQADGERSGEFFLIDLTPNPDLNWPPRCGSEAAPGKQ